MRIVERNTPPVLPRVEPVEEKHLWDYVRVVYKRRWVALPAFLLIFVFMTMNSMRQTPLYRSQVQLLIEKDAPTVTSLDQMFQSQDGWFNDEFYQTQHRILQSRTLAKRTIDLMKLWDAPKLGNGPDVRGTINPMAVVWSGIDGAIALAKRPFVGETAAPAPAKSTPERPSASENAAQAARISEFLGALSVVPVRNTRLVEIRYVSTDPVFAAQAANAVAEAYIQQTMEFRASTSKEAGDFLGEQLDQQRKAVEASERALQEFKEQNGAVSINDGNSSITMQRLTELNVALIKARTERISKEALYNQLKAMQANGTIDTFPAVLANDYIQGLKTNLNELQRQHAQLGERLGENNPRFVESRSALQSAQAKLTAEINKVVEGVSNEYRAAAAQEQSLQAAMNSQQGQMMGQNKMGVQYTVLQRDADSNRQIYENLLQRAKEAGISGERRTTNVRVIDQAEVPGGAFHPNVRSDMTFAFMAGLVFAFALAFGFEYLDNRIKTPQELKANINVPFLGMVPTLAAEKDAPANPLLNNGVPQNFAEAFKSIRTNVLFSTAEEGMRTLVVTSAGPGEGKSLVASNLAMALAQAGQRVLLVDCDMRRPRVHEIFEGPQEPGLSNVLSGNAKTSEAIRKASLPGLWLMPAGHIPPNPAELLAARRFNDLMTSLDTHFDWVVLDTPPVMVVADSSIVANQASGVVFVVRADKTTKQSVRAAAEQLDAANAHLIGSVLNGADVLRNPYYYSAYYRKDYARYYVASSSKASAGGRG